MLPESSAIEKNVIGPLMGQGCSRGTKIEMLQGLNMRFYVISKHDVQSSIVGGKLLNFSKLKLNDFHFVEMKNENGQIEQFYHNNKDYSSTKQRGRSKNKVRFIKYFQR